MEQYNILIVEDDKEIRDGIEIFLKSQNYNVFKAADGVEGLEVMEREKISLAIVDIMMPRMDGVTMTMKLREKYDFPVIMLSAKSEETDKVIGLNIGADDYVTKPFRTKELIARIYANTRKAGREKLVPVQKETGTFNGGYNNGELRLDEDTMSAYRGQLRMELTLSEYRLFQVFMHHIGQILTREQLMERLWSVDEAFVDDNTLSVYMRRLRQKLDAGREISCITTIRGVGYRMESLKE